MYILTMTKKVGVLKKQEKVIDRYEFENKDLCQIAFINLVSLYSKMIMVPLNLKMYDDKGNIINEWEC